MILRTLPHSIEAEELLLSTCFVDGRDVVGRCLEAKLEANCFYERGHEIVFQTILELYNAGVSIDPQTVAEELKRSAKLDAVGGYAFLTRVSSLTPTTLQAAYYIDRVREQAILRNIIRAGTTLVEGCYSFDGDLDEFVDQAERDLFAVTQHRIADRTRSVKQITQSALRTLTGMVAHRGELTGLATGFADLDALLWGLQRQDMVVLAARPSMGKTALALGIAEAAVLPKRGERTTTLMFSMEMSADQLMHRMICSRARVSMKLLRDGMLSKNGEESQRILEAADQLANSPLYIDDSSSIPVSYIRARARRVHQRTPLGLVIVDYLQLMAPIDHRMPREQQVAEASRGLKALAKELNVPVLVLSQLNRSAEKEGRRPNLSDLRESGAIEQDADVVLMLARPKDDDSRSQVAGDTADLIVAKQRNGPTGDIRLTFLRDITRFENFHQ